MVLCGCSPGRRLPAEQQLRRPHGLPCQAPGSRREVGGRVRNVKPEGRPPATGATEHYRRRMSNAALTAQEHHLYMDAFETLTECVDCGYVDRHGGVFTAVTHSPIALFNILLVEEDDATPDDFASAIDAIAQVGVPYSTHLRRGIDDRMRPVVEASPMERSDVTVPGMVMEPVLDHDPPAGLEVRVGRHPDLFASHCDIVSEAFGIPLELVATFMTDAFREHPQVTFYLGLVGGEPVATSFGFRRGTAVTLFNVATREAHRRKGYGAAMTMLPAIGAERAFLQASQAGLPVYEGLGFRSIVEYEEWTAEPSSRARVRPERMPALWHPGGRWRRW